VHLVTALGDVAILSEELGDLGESNQGIKSRYDDLRGRPRAIRRLRIKWVRLQVVGSMAQPGTRKMEIDVDVVQLPAFG
jgi:hypothetical protein